MQVNDFTIVIGFVFGILLFYKLPKLDKTKQINDGELFTISVIIPARNEEKNLPFILTDLNSQTYNIHEIICVDDNSEDNTVKVIADHGAQCEQLSTLLDGWKGKTWACQTGARKATGEVLLFIDADVRLSKDAIERLADRFSVKQAPISVQPYHIVKKQHEFFSLIFNMIQLCSTSISFFRSKKNIGVFGPLMMIPKKIFDEHGGYEVVKDSVAEDFNLGRYYDKQGVQIDLLLGGEYITYRMYPNSIAQVVEGWSKNFSSASIMLKAWLRFCIIGWLAYLTILPVELFKAAATQQTVLILLLSALYFITVLLLYRICKSMGSYPFIVCLFYPVYLVMFHIVYIYSFFATFIFKSTTWKGRKL